jgi:hypothetical protein
VLSQRKITFYELIPNKIGVVDRYIEIDKRIISEVTKATGENSNIWTCPEFNRREYLRNFFQYPAMMVPVVQRKLIEIVLQADSEIKNMVDPFMGSATTLAACMETGIDCYGFDINPLAILIAKVRTGPYFLNDLKHSQSQLVENIGADKSEYIEVDFRGLSKWFKPEIAKELSRLVRAIRKVDNLSIRRFLWVILSETVRLTSNDRTSTFKLHARPQEEILNRNLSATDLFKYHLAKSLEDYRTHVDYLTKFGMVHNGSYTGNVEIKLLNSKDGIFNPTAEPFYDLLVTSPPYGDNKTTVTYGQHSYLPLQWIDLPDIDETATRDFLRTTSEIDRRSLGGITSQLNQVDLISLLEISPTFRNTYQSIINTNENKHNKVAAFILDLNKTLDNIFQVLKKNSYQIWTIGNRRVAGLTIPNSKILIELIESKGGKLVTQVEREIINKRMAKRNKDTALMNNEDILIFRKLG